MKGVYKIKINREVITYDNYNDIPENIGAVISFLPDYPEPPHTQEEHELIHTFNSKLQQLIKRECQQLLG